MKILILFLIIFNFYLSLKVLKRKYRKNKKGKIVNIGSSHSRDCFKAIKDIELDLSYASQTFHFDYEILKKYKMLLEKNSIVFLNISYFSFASKFM